MPLWERLKPVKALAFLAGLFILPYLIVECTNVLDPYGHVTIFNVGQGDSSFIELPHHKMTMLIDTGGTLPVNEANWKKKRVPYDVGVKVVYHELQAMGVKKLNYLVLTHRDYDHIGGAEGLLRHIRVDYILINDHFIIKERERRLFEMAKQKGTKIMIIGHHQTLHIAGYDFRFFSVNHQNPTSNNGSLVLSVRLGGIRWLFTGDLEEEGENELLTQVPDLNTDVLKVGHHGSKTSTTESWLKTLTPKLAIISVGRHNRYGHPSPEVVERIKKDGIPVIRTDKRGEIDFEFKENHLIGLNTAN